MTAKCKKFVLIVLAAVFGLCLFAACSFEPTLDEIKDRYNLAATVTYHANGGYFDGEKESVSIYYGDGSRAIDVGINEVTKLPERTINLTREGYSIGGWYTAAKDENGNVLYEDEEKGIVKLGEPADFSVTLKSGDEWELYASWLRNQTVQVLLALDSDAPDGKITYTPKDGKERTYKAGDLLKEYELRGKTGVVGKPSLNVITETRGENPAGFTFLDFYTDKECTKKAEWPVSRSENGENVLIYAKFITGEWNFVSTANDLVRMLQKRDNLGKAYNANNYYFLGDIDCSSYASFALNEDHEFAGEIRGNGYKISGLSVNQTGVGNAMNAGVSVSLFGKLSSTAKISDLTIENLSLSISNKLNASICVYLFSHEISSGAEVKNVVISGGSLKMTFNGNAGSLLFNGKPLAETTTCPIYASAEPQPGITCEGEQIYKYSSNN